MRFVVTDLPARRRASRKPSRRCNLTSRVSPRSRQLHLEQLEERQLLSISAGWDARAMASFQPTVASAWFEDLTPSHSSNLPAGTQSADGQAALAATQMTNLQSVSVDAAPSQWLVQLTPSATAIAGAVDRVGDVLKNSAVGVQVVRGLDIEGLVLVSAQPGANTATVETWLANNPAIAYFESNVILATNVIPNDTSFSELWGMNNTGQTGGKADADIDAPEAWDVATGSSSIVVGIIDTGVDYTHPDLAANIWTNPGEISGNGIDDDGNGFVDDVHGYDFVNNDGDPMDDNSHGTHVAGTIAGVGDNNLGVTGVNWTSSVMALKFLDSSGTGWISDAVRAVNYATLMKTQFGANIKLTSNSWAGGGYSQSLYDAIEAGGNAGMLFVTAAGNSGSDNDVVPTYPANYDLPNIIAVAATDSSDVLAGFSCYGATSVDLAAPGVDIYSTVPGGGYASYSGTSMATPHVAGVAALAWSVAPGATYQQIRDAIFQGVDPIASLSGRMVTGGRLNARNTLDQLAVGLRVTGSSPTGGILPPLSYLEFSFNAAMDTSSFAVADDVASFAGPAGVDLKSEITGFAWVDNQTLRVDFSPQSAAGTYSMVIGPNILGADGLTPLNQDGDDTPGEIPDDRYTATVTILTPIYVVNMDTDPGRRVGNV